MVAAAEDAPIAQNLRRVRAEIAAAEREAGRAVGSVRLVAVSKTHSAQTVRVALAAGHRLYGENRVQEAEGKWPLLREAWPDLVLHLIGPLQRNKVKRAVSLFDAIESIDRPEIARAIAEAAAAQGRCPTLYVQVNTGGEPQKAGVLPERADDFLRMIRDDLRLPVLGLMCIPPVEEAPAMHFTLLREIARRNGLAELSMGMSADFATAIRFGATLVRVGTAIFGGRPLLAAALTRPPAADQP